MLRCPHCQKLKSTPDLNKGETVTVKCPGCSGSYAIERTEGGTVIVAKVWEKTTKCPTCKSKKIDALYPGPECSVFYCWDCEEHFAPDWLPKSLQRLEFEPQPEPLESQLQAAIAREDYETAAQLRDRIKELTA
jgi:excinuclease UvrABC helicase subunit UvrB